MASKRMVRIANAGGYWGDDPYALRRQVRGEVLVDYVSIDFLSEITMSILEKQRARDPGAGYARDFLTQLEPVLGECREKGIKIITNAGGINPRACGEAVLEAARAEGLSLKVAVITGDDVTPRLGELLESGAEMKNLDTGEPLAAYADRVLAANAYFGARPVVEALRAGADIVVSGRVTDTGITLAPLVHEFGWSDTDYDLLAHGVVAGHIIECGAQATGGNFTDWPKVASFVDIGFPIVECEPDGSFIVTKQPGTGGLVSDQTVREQLLYEMGDPRSYITPDVVADFTTIELASDGPDRVRVSGVRGYPPTDLLKVSVAYDDGYKVSGSLIVSGPDARAKAVVFAEVFWIRLQQELRLAGLGPLERTATQFVGSDSTHRALTPPHRPTEVFLLLGASDKNREKLETFRKLLPSLILSGPAGVAVTGGAPAISQVVGYWPALIPQDRALPSIEVFEAGGADGAPRLVQQTKDLAWPVTGGSGKADEALEDPHPTTSLAGGEGEEFCRVPLMVIAHARSGDKGNSVNIGLIGRSPACYVWLRENVTASRVKEWFKDVALGEVHRYLVPRLWALNFIMEDSLGGGGTVSLFIDAQGKTLSQALLRCEVEVPEALLSTIEQEDSCCPGELSGGFPK
jgi:hypothetical protein